MKKSKKNTREMLYITSRKNILCIEKVDTLETIKAVFAYGAGYFIFSVGFFQWIMQCLY